MNPETDDDVGLMQRCLAGEEAALRAFVDRYQGLVFALCFRMLSHRQDAEDTTQETLLRAIRHLGQWEPARPFKPWLLAIAANRCRTRLGQRSRKPVELGDRAPDVAAPAEPQALSEELQRAVGGLRDDYRLCFVMFYQQELSVQEIAETLKCPEGTIKTWLYRARKQIANELVERGVVDRDGYELHGL
ncbi:MAG: RNA polymerase sigma factor [Planctomycetaceae bacterium]|nr:RNA polymerase sigma factor [Planctomycetaceae bacterium]